MTTVKPDTISFNAVLDAWACSTHRDAPYRADHLVRQMEEFYRKNAHVRPDVITYSTLLHVWAKSGHVESASRAEQILAHMEAAGTSSCQPDIVMYNTVLHALAKSGDQPASAKKAEEIFSRMQSTKNGLLPKPDVITYNTVLQAMAKTDDPGAAKLDGSILQNIVVKPDARTYTAVIHVCANTRGGSNPNETLGIAFRVFETQRLSSHPPNAHTYSAILSVCDNNLPKDDQQRRHLLAKDLFVLCCEAGYVNDYVRTKLKKLVSRPQYAELMGNMTTHWARNIPSARHISSNNNYENRRKFRRK